MNDPPDAFTELVRDALLNLYDLPALQAHLLLPWVDSPDARVAARSRALRQDLRDAINAFYPAAGAAGSWRAWRSYRILELRYLEGQDVAAVMDQVALSKAQYHREHARGLQAVAAVLWERWRLAGRWSAPDAPTAAVVGGNDDPTRREAERLVRSGRAGHIDAAAVVRGVGRVLQPLCAAHGVELRLQLPDAAVEVAGDRVALRQALLGLLAPAVTESSDGLVELLLTAEGRQAVIEIRGAAAGPPPAGALGAAESRPFIAALRGTLAHQPAARPGARWTLRLVWPTGLQPQLLVVDNNADFIRLVDRYLAAHGWTVIAAEDAEQAYQYAQHCQPRAILLDVVLPDRDGWDLLMELKALPTTSAIPIVICSVLEEPEVALSLGAAAYLHKPIDERGLVAALTPFH